MAECALDIARSFAPREHYHLDVAGRTLVLSPSGRELIADAVRFFRAVPGAAAREQLVTQAWTATSAGPSRITCDRRAR